MYNVDASTKLVITCLRIELHIICKCLTLMSLGKSIILLTVSPVSDLKRANTVLASGSDIFEKID